MRSTLAREKARRLRARQLDYDTGKMTGLLRLSAQAADMAAVPDASKLATEYNPTVLQNGSGASYFLVGYSAFGGGDVLL